MDRLLRLLVVKQQPIANYDLSALRAIGPRVTHPMRKAFKFEGTAWVQVKTA